MTTLEALLLTVGVLMIARLFWLEFRLWQAYRRRRLPTVRKPYWRNWR